MTTSRVFVWVLSALFISALLWTDSGEAMAQDETPTDSDSDSDGDEASGDQTPEDEVTVEPVAGDGAADEPAADDGAGEPKKETKAERRKRLREERKAARQAKREQRRLEKQRKAEEKKRKAEERRRKRAEARARARGETLPEAGDGDGGEAASGDGGEAASGDGGEAAGEGQDNAADGNAEGGETAGDGTAANEEQEEERPWAKGVSKEDQEAALSLFRDGNKLLKDALFVRAEAKYKEALDRWDHPGIHFNRALALLNLDQPLVLHASLEKAMQYGADALGRGQFARAETMMQTVQGQLAYLEIVCMEPDAEVTLDGKRIFTAPGNWKGLVVVGKHNVVASKAGYINAIEVREMKARERGSIELQLFTADDVTEYRRRWAIWKPWTVFGTGTAITLTGGLMHLFSFQNFDAFDAAIAACGGCAKEDLENPDDAKLQDRAQLQQNIAFSMYAVGGVTVLTGLVLVYANRNQPYRIDVEERDRNNLVVTPVISPQMTGVSAQIRF